MSRVVIASILTLIFLALLTTGVYFYQKYSIILIDPIKGVPQDAAFIIEAKKPSASLRNFFEENKNLQDSWFKEIEIKFIRLDSLLQLDKDAGDIWKNQSLVISAHLVNADRFDYLFLANLPRGWSEKRLKKQIESVSLSGKKLVNDFTKREYESINIYESQINDSLKLTFAAVKSVAFFSYTPLLVESAIRQLKQSEGAGQTRALKRAVSLLPALTGKKNTDEGIYLYLNYPNCSDFMSALAGDNKNLFFNLTTSVAQWSAFNIQHENENILLKGSSTADTIDYLSFFRDQQSQHFSASDIAPSHTALLFESGFSNFKQYYKNLKKSSWNFTVQNNPDTSEQKNNQFSSELAKGFQDWVGKEAALLITEPAGNDIDNNVYALVQTRNPSEALSHLDSFRISLEKTPSISMNPQGTSNAFHEEYRSSIISFIPQKNIVPAAYGKAFSRLSNCYYTSVNDFIVFANHPTALKTLIDEVSEGHLLSKDSVYVNNERTQQDNSNVRLYISPKRSQNLYSPSRIISFFTTLYRSSGIIAQWKYQEDNVATQISLNFRSKTMRNPVLLWTAQLDTVISCFPVMVCGNGNNNNHSSESSTSDCNFFVQDAKNNFYKINESGNIIWKKDLGEKILSEIHSVDIYHDGRHQLLFNTERKLYLTNTTGENIGNYPIRLPAAASNGCSILSTPSSYHIIIACVNKYIYNYDANGKPATDWQYIHTDELVTKRIETFLVNASAYLVISETNGTVIIADANGATINSFKGKFIESNNSHTGLITETAGSEKPTESSKISWMTTDTSGSIIQFSLSGDVKTKSLSKFSSNHSFIFDETNKLPTGENMMIYADAERIVAYGLQWPFNNGEEEKKWSIDIPGLIPSTLTNFLLNDGISFYGVSSTRNLFYLISPHGEVAKGFPVKSSLYPAFFSNNNQLLVCGQPNGLIYVYKTE